MDVLSKKDNKKKEILEAAIRVFSKRGLYSSKISDIAINAGVGKGTVYEYFRSKDDLFKATFNYFFDKVEAFISRKCFRTYDPLDKLITYIKSWGEILESGHLDYIEVILDYWAEGIRRKDNSTIFNIIKIYDENRKMLISILDECIEKKKIRPVDTIITSSIILGCLDGLLLQWITDQNIFNIKNATDQLAGLIIEGIGI